ncbi:MAG: 4Fe-4S binding protein [Bacteroidales bacterium]|nr:4Fe-4S binding protein [Bacteroidales bacterium]
MDMTIHQITFSPTGGTRRVCELLCQNMGHESRVTELCVPADRINYPDIKAEDLAVIAMPVYAGRVPALAVARLRNIVSHGAKCAVVAVYGNRAYDDALVEMQDVATEMGFQVIAAVAAIAEHSICRMYGAGRPDEADATELASFGVAIMNDIAAGAFHPLHLPGNRPYKQGGSGPFPTADDSCTGCGTCADLCPAGAIPLDHLQGNDNALCIGCMKCVSVCPVHARSIGPTLDRLVARLEPLCRERKGNEMFKD